MTEKSGPYDDMDDEALVQALRQRSKEVRQLLRDIGTILKDASNV